MKYVTKTRVKDSCRSCEYKVNGECTNKYYEGTPTTEEYLEIAPKCKKCKYKVLCSMSEMGLKHPCFNSLIDDVEPLPTNFCFLEELKKDLKANLKKIKVDTENNS